MRIKPLQLSCSIFVLVLLPLLSAAQQGTLADKGKMDRESASKHKIMLVPFEPRLYLGEVDFAIHAETKLSSKQIKNQFRDGLNEQIGKALKKTGFTCLDLMDDTVKYKKDTESLYRYLVYDYVKVPDQNNYKPPVKEKSQKSIEKGQLNVETNSEIRFMNARLTNPELLPALYNKYKSDVIIFINQLDLKAGGGSDVSQPYRAPDPNRKIIVHYTVMNKDGKELNSGTVEEEFSPELNVPKKIIDKHFSRIALVLSQRVLRSLGTVSR
ncbi:MAG TPA: hypothetical protein PLQ93_06375 [Bacteroidia bacterium]|nr:hypothetical protein [Bacteroidia bacterium]